METSTLDSVDDEEGVMVQPSTANSLDEQLANKNALIRYLEDNRAKFLRYACTRLRENVDDAEDVIQEVFCNLLRRPCTYDPSKKMEGYLYAVIDNACKDYYQSQYGRFSPTLSLTQCGSRASKYSEREKRIFSPSLEQDPCEQCVTSEREAIVSCALDTLKPELREAIELTCYKGLTFTKASQLLNLPIGTVKNRAFQARQKLKKLLKVFNQDAF